MKRYFFGMIVFAAWPVLPLSADVPQKYIDVFGDMAIAATGAQMCTDIDLDQANFSAQGDAIRAQAQADGMSDQQIDDMMSALEANPDILMSSMMAFGEKHAVSPTDTSGFCQAIMAEKMNGTRLGKMVK